MDTGASHDVCRSIDEVVSVVDVESKDKVDALSEELQPRSVPAAPLQPLYNYRYEPIPMSRT